jgi:hypothetical protein
MTKCPTCGGPCTVDEKQMLLVSLVKGEVVADMNVTADYECGMDAYLVGLHLEFEDWPKEDVPVRVLVIQKEARVIQERNGA